MIVHEPAPAKVNLTLAVRGRRADGYHELESLAVFADVGDALTLETDGPPSVATEGPFAAAITGENLLERALRLMAERVPGLKLGRVRLDKRLPVAAGLGGGSADAGALIRAVRRANPAVAAGIDWPAIARALGADVPVCLASRPMWMWGTGERMVPMGDRIAPGVLPLAAVLVNPLAPVPPDKTARVFRALAAGPLPPDHKTSQPPAIASRRELVALIRDEGNELEVPATRVVPQVADVLDALRGLPDCEAAAMSGAGPTCFALVGDHRVAAARLSLDHPGWWVAPAELG